MNIQPNYPSILLSVMALASGLVMLSAGGEFLVSGAVKLARRLGMARILIGLTVVAFGTSMPELFVSIIALFQDHSDIMVGNIIGSNIANIGLILGLSALMMPLKLDFTTIRMELYLLLTVSLLTMIISWYGIFTRPFGLIFTGSLILYTFFSYRQAARNRNNIHNSKPISQDGVASGTLHRSHAHSLIFIVGLISSGLVMMALGSDFIIKGAVDVARYMGLTELIIGLTLAAVGTSLPELASSLAAIRRRQNDLLVGNIIGSNLFNLLMVLGCGSIMRPFILSPELLQRDLPVMFAFSAVLIPIFSLRQGLGKLSGLALLVTYGFYIFILVRPDQP